MTMFYLLYKEKGVSSFKAINQWARNNNIKKVGHTGTLDPMATGLLLIATDSDTKLIDCIKNHDKRYIVEMEFGYETDTLDAEGQIIKTSEKVINIDEVFKAIESFNNLTYDQIPPLFSAKKVNGQRAYDLARGGNLSFELKTKPVTIYNIKNVEQLSESKFKFEVFVSNGTYIRSLVRDIAHKIDSLATMTSLVRTEIHGIDIVNKDKEINWKLLFTGYEIADVNIIQRIFHGKELKPNTLKDNSDNILVSGNDIIGLITLHSGKVVKSKLLGKKMGEK